MSFGGVIYFYMVEKFIRPCTLALFSQWKTLEGPCATRYSLFLARRDFLYTGKERIGSELVERWTNVLGVKEPLQRVLVCAWLAMTSHCDQIPRDSHVFFFFFLYTGSRRQTPDP